MPLPLWEKIVLFWVFMHVVGPVVLRFTFRFSATCHPSNVAREGLPPAVRALFDRWSNQIQGLGFTLVGYYDMGMLASGTRSFLAYFVNRTSGEFANVSVVQTKEKTQGYFEFSSSFTNGLTLDTNVNKTISISSTPPDILIFRFPEFTSPVELYRIHRALVQKHAAFLRPQMPPEGQEHTRIAQQIGRFGPCQAKAGYMWLVPDTTHYLLTWKGACLMTWKSLWPTSLIRRALYRAHMQKLLTSLRTEGFGGLSPA